MDEPIYIDDEHPYRKRLLKRAGNRFKQPLWELQNCGFYDASKTFITAGYIADTDSTGSGNYVGFNKDGDDWVRANFTTFAGVSDWSAVKYIRLTLELNNAASAIASVDAVLNSGMKIYAE